MPDTPPTSAQLEALIPAVVDLAHNAARRILKIYQSPDIEIEHKADNSPVTSADLAANNVIQAGLDLLTPDWPILSEERCDIPYSQRQKWSRYWLIDPLDGTRQFISGKGQFSVNIALIEGHSPVLGVVLTPQNNVLYYAWKDGGAWRKDPSKPAHQIRCKAVNRGHVRITSNHSQAKGQFAIFLNNIGGYQHLRMGSSVKSCMIAEGLADLYPRLGDTSEWDTAAAQIIVEEAGGHIVDTAMRPLRYNTKDCLLNPHFFVSGDKQMDWSRCLPDDYQHG